MAVVSVRYNAKTALSDEKVLEDLVRNSIEQYVHSIRDVSNKDVQLHVQITRFSASASKGECGFSLHGTVNGVEILDDIQAVDVRRRHGVDRIEEAWLGNLLFLLFRSFFPNRMTKVLGRSVVSVRVERALEECLAGVRAQIDRSLGRAVTSDESIWKAAKWQAFALAIATLVIAVLVAWLHQIPGRDEVQVGMACLVMPASVFAFWIGLALLRIPKRFYQSDPRGRKLVKLVGVKSPAAIRAVGGGMVVVSLAFAVVAVGVLS
ncbi:hypothetical protein [Rhodopirellula sallentina]|uniref:Membrane protein n=1 Tax=Rhodopirellula sallentina SM41 TaxID=1263870 RepID=M5UDC6_9BACT|nr:hypothetical protein [Rhodopirellula sallentina]EMI55856.1 membrane protein [Rhodopirellula sallentina SM41]